MDTHVDWEAIGWAEQMPHDVAIDYRLESLSRALDEGTVRLVGTNVVALTMRMTDEEIVQRADYSIIEDDVVIDEHSTVGYSYVGKSASIENGSSVFRSQISDSRVKASSVSHSSIKHGSTVEDYSTVREGAVVFATNITEGSTVEGGTAKYSLVDGRSQARNSNLQEAVITEESYVDDSSIRNSKVSNSRVSGKSKVERTKITNGARIINSAIGTVDIVGHSLENAVVSKPKHLMDFGELIGTGRHVYAYQLHGGELEIRAGCKTFSSTYAMTSYANKAKEYKEELGNKKLRRLYVKQVNALADLIDLTRADW